jgi:malonate-semialdehyde dehydrogenase (acetylating)/methylmalonate-semialdehyde dehydrogenase
VNCGQVCICNERTYVHRKIAKEFVGAFIQQVRDLKLGNPVDGETAIGPKVNRGELEKVERYVNEAREAGATVLTGGKRPSEQRFQRGYWFEPTVLVNVSQDMRIMQEEVFGPVLAIIRAKNLDEAIQIENNSKYGNAASVFTESGALARQVMERASAGMIGVNVGVPVPREPFSFGGWNESKFGVGDITGKSSLEFWTKLKKTTVKWNAEAKTNWMS